MDIHEARNLVIQAGKRLVASGLIARTWGNASCRVDDDHFVITPSGIPYDRLTPKEIVLVDRRTLSYEGEVKPSSEKGIHAVAYSLRRQVGFVIHTHQDLASVVSTSNREVSVGPDEAKLIGNRIPVARYGLPGTKKLRAHVTEELQDTASKAILLANHGTLCMGTDLEDAFTVATALENRCRTFLIERCIERPSETADVLRKLLETTEQPLLQRLCSRREGDHIHFTEGTESHTVAIDGKPASPWELLHLRIYRNHHDIGAIITNDAPEALASAARGKRQKPYLDDVAQIIGPTIEIVEKDGNIDRAMRRRNGILMSGRGALCYGADMDDAHAVEMIMRKNCLASLASSLFAETRHIGPFDSRLMRFVYTRKYAKRAQRR